MRRTLFRAALVAIVIGIAATRVSDVKVTDGELTAMFPGYENTLRAQMNRDGLEGSVTLIKAGGKQQVIPSVAKRGETSKAILLLEQSHDHVTGSAMTPTGDHRFLEGQMHGDELQLSTFAGGLAYLYKLKVGTDGGLEGDYWQGLASHEKVVAHRNESATLDGAGKQTTLRDSAQAFAFTRKGAVRSIHTGFAGPATGRHHDEYVKEFTEQVEQLLTESGG